MILLTPGLTSHDTHFANINGFAAGGRDGDELSSWRPGLTVVDAETEIDTRAAGASVGRGLAGVIVGVGKSDD